MGSLPTTATTPKGDPDNLSCASRKNWGCYLQTKSENAAGLRSLPSLGKAARPLQAPQVQHQSQCLAPKSGLELQQLQGSA